MHFMKLQPDIRSEGTPHTGHRFHCSSAIRRSKEKSVSVLERKMSANVSHGIPSCLPLRHFTQNSVLQLVHSTNDMLYTSGVARKRASHPGTGQSTINSSPSGFHKFIRNCKNLSQSTVPRVALSTCDTVIPFLHSGIGHTSSSSATFPSQILDSRCPRKHPSQKKC